MADFICQGCMEKVDEVDEDGICPACLETLAADLDEIDDDWLASLDEEDDADQGNDPEAYSEA